MATKINKSFVWGVCIASCTWIVSLYLFWRLTTSTPISTSPAVTTGHHPAHQQLPLSNGFFAKVNSIDTHDKSFAFFDKYDRKKKKTREQRLREELLQDLEPKDVPIGNGNYLR